MVGVNWCDGLWEPYCCLIALWCGRWSFGQAPDQRRFELRHCHEMFLLVWTRAEEQDETKMDTVQTQNSLNRQKETL